MAANTQITTYTGGENVPSVEDVLGVAVSTTGRLFERAVMHRHGGERGADLIGEAACRELGQALAPLSRFLCEAAFVIATDRYEPSQAHRDPGREQAKEFIVECLDCSRRTADYACQQVDLVMLLSIGKTGMPDVRQLNAIVWTGVGRPEWGKVNAWVMRKGGFVKVTPEALRHYCQGLKDDADAERKAPAPLPAGDPHDPPDVEVVTAEPVAATPGADILHDELLDFAKDEPVADGPKWADEALAEEGIDDILGALWKIARGTPDVLAEIVDRKGLDDFQLRAVVLACLELGERPADRIPPFTVCPRPALIKGLQGIAAITREQVGLA